MNTNNLIIAVVIMILGVALFPAVDAATNTAIDRHSTDEYTALTEFTQKPLTNLPLISFTSLKVLNDSGATNAVAAAFSDSLLKSLSTNSAGVPFHANLTINCEYNGSDVIYIYLNSYYLGSISALDACPKVLTSIDQVIITDPASTLEFRSNGTESNFTYAGLNYTREVAWANYNVSIASGNITAGTTATYHAYYVYGNGSVRNSSLLSIIPFLYVLFMLAFGVKMIYDEFN